MDHFNFSTKLCYYSKTLVLVLLCTVTFKGPPHISQLGPAFAMASTGLHSLFQVSLLIQSPPSRSKKFLLPWSPYCIALLCSILSPSFYTWDLKCYSLPSPMLATPTSIWYKASHLLWLGLTYGDPSSNYDTQIIAYQAHIIGRDVSVCSQNIHAH
jgi:hypothetical protein